MKKQIFIITFIVSLFLVITGFQASFTKEMSGYDIMKRHKDWHKANTEFEKQTWILVDKSGNKSTRTVHSWGKETGKDIHKGLLVFLSPGNIKGTSIMTWQKKEGDDDQWLYEPANKKVQRLSSGSKKNYFMGTDFIYEDLQSEELEDHNYKVLKKEKVDGDNCFVVEAKPKDKKNTSYGKRILWVHAEKFYAVKTDFYSLQDKLIKTQVSRNFKKAGGKKYRPEENVMINHDKKTKTLVKIDKRDIDKGIKTDFFSERQMQAF
jgi:hypothetical protein